MSIVAGKSRIAFEPKMSVAMDAVAIHGTPQALRPTLGPLANVRYKPTRWVYLAQLSAVPTQGEADIKLMAGQTVIASQTVTLNGVSTFSLETAVDMSQVAGETQLRVEVDVTAAADAGITATLDSFVDIEQPLTQYGC